MKNSDVMKLMEFVFRFDYDVDLRPSPRRTPTPADQLHDDVDAAVDVVVGNL